MIAPEASINTVFVSQFVGFTLSRGYDLLAAWSLCYSKCLLCIMQWRNWLWLNTCDIPVLFKMLYEWVWYYFIATYINTTLNVSGFFCVWLNAHNVNIIFNFQIALIDFFMFGMPPNSVSFSIFLFHLFSQISFLVFTFNHYLVVPTVSINSFWREIFTGYLLLKIDSKC